MLDWINALVWCGSGIGQGRNTRRAINGNAFPVHW